MLSSKSSRFVVLNLVALSLLALSPASAQARLVSSRINDLLQTAEEAAREIAPAAVLLRAVGSRTSSSDCVEGKDWDFQFLDPSQGLENGYRIGYSIRFSIDPTQCGVAELILPTQPRIVTRDRLDWDREVPGLGETRRFHPAQVLSLAAVQKSIQGVRAPSEWTQAILKNREGGLRPYGIFFEVTSNEGRDSQNQSLVEAYTGEVAGVWDYDPYRR